MNDDPIDNEAILGEIIDVLKKHNIPVNTMSVNISLLDDDFDNTFPNLQHYKEGHYSRHRIVKGTPATIIAQRRLPFDEIAMWMDENILPNVKMLGGQIMQEFGEIKTYLESGRGQDYLGEFYHISLECRRIEELKREEGNTVGMFYHIRQIAPSSYPEINAEVGWLVDEESGDDWGIHIVYNMVRQNVWPGSLKGQLRESIQKNLSDQLRKECKILMNRGTPPLEHMYPSIE